MLAFRQGRLKWKHTRRQDGRLKWKHTRRQDAHAACYLGIGNKSIQVAPLLSEKFTESGDYKMCCKAPDYS